MITLICMAIREFREGRKQMKKGEEMLRGLAKPMGRRKRRYSKAGVER